METERHTSASGSRSSSDGGHSPSGHLPTFVEDDLPRCVYDCRKTYENINMLDLMFERRANDLGGGDDVKGALIRSCYWMLNDLLEKGMTLTDVRYAIQTDVPLSEAKRVREHGGGERRRELEDVLEELHAMLDSLRSSNGDQPRPSVPPKYPFREGGETW